MEDEITSGEDNGGETSDHSGGASANPIMRYFEFAHLPEHLQEVSGEVYTLACSMEVMLNDGPEKSAGLRKLLEAKDCFVRAALPS